MQNVLIQDVTNYLYDNYKDETIENIFYFLTIIAQKNLSKKRWEHFIIHYNRDCFNNRNFSGYVLNGVKYSYKDLENKKEKMIYSYLSYFDDQSLFKLYQILPKSDFKTIMKREEEEEEM